MIFVDNFIWQSIVHKEWIFCVRDNFNISSLKTELIYSFFKWNGNTYVLNSNFIFEYVGSSMSPSYRIAMTDEYVAIGNPDDSEKGYEQGKVYVFKYNG